MNKDLDIVIDTNVMRLYDTPSDPTYKQLFAWVAKKGSLAVSQKLLVEYMGTTNEILAGLINHLTTEDRLIRINNHALKTYSLDKHYVYSCNRKDINHARLTFLSNRKKLVSLDNPLIKDVNSFPKVDGIKPEAKKRPNSNFYDC